LSRYIVGVAIIALSALLLIGVYGGKAAIVPPESCAPNGELWKARTQFGTSRSVPDDLGKQLAMVAARDES
jgi:hypothetical protein